MHSNLERKEGRRQSIYWGPLVHQLNYCCVLLSLNKVDIIIIIIIIIIIDIQIWYYLDRAKF